MTSRRWLGAFALLAMMHFIIVGNAAACPSSAAAVPMTHVACATDASHGNHGSKDAAQMVPCCDAVTSCVVTPLVSRGESFDRVAPISVATSRFADRVPRAEVPAPELPPPKA